MPLEQDEMICFLSMANPNGPMYCRRDCKAYLQKGADTRQIGICIAVQFMGSASYNIKAIGNHFMKIDYNEPKKNDWKKKDEGSSDDGTI